jgi:hypothetical protein
MGISNKYECEQVAVLMVFAAIVLFGFAAMAIDGGRLYLHRRSAQNAADDAVMTTALAITYGYYESQIEYIARERAKQNGFDNSGNSKNIEVYWPPRPFSMYVGNRNYVQIIIISEIYLTFIEVVYNEPLLVTVEAIVHARVNEDISPGFAAFVNNLSASRTIHFDGSLTFDLTGGGSIGSNSISGCICDGYVRRFV